MNSRREFITLLGGAAARLAARGARAAASDAGDRVCAPRQPTDFRRTVLVDATQGKCADQCVA
jgi:hypothetical protein